MGVFMSMAAAIAALVALVSLRSGIAVTAHSSVSVPTVNLHNGVRMPVIAAGTWKFTTENAKSSVEAALGVGFTHIDTAHNYCANGTT